MRWITRKSLEREFGLSWVAAEKIIRDEVAAQRRGKRRHSWLLACLWLASLLWVITGARLVFPATHHGMLLLAELPGLVLMGIAVLVLPRLLASGAILVAAEQQQRNEASRCSGCASAA